MEIFYCLLLNGADDAHEWIGTVPYEKLPSAFDPPDGIIATANARMSKIAVDCVAGCGEDRMFRVPQQPPRPRNRLREGAPFARDDIDTMIGLAQQGIAVLIAAQRAALGK